MATWIVHMEIVDVRATSGSERVHLKLNYETFLRGRISPSSGLASIVEFQILGKSSPKLSTHELPFRHRCPPLAGMRILEKFWFGSEIEAD